MGLTPDCNGLPESGDGLSMAAKVRLQQGQVEQCILVESAVSGLDCVVKVPVEMVEGGRMVPGLP